MCLKVMKVMMRMNDDLICKAIFNDFNYLLHIIPSETSFEEIKTITYSIANNIGLIDGEKGKELLEYIKEELEIYNECLEEPLPDVDEIERVVIQTTRIAELDKELQDGLVNEIRKAINDIEIY